MESAGPLLSYAAKLAQREQARDRILAVLPHVTARQALECLRNAALWQLDDWSPDDPRVPELRAFVANVGRYLERGRA